MIRMCMKVLGQIVTTFRNLETFWKMQANYCETLLNARFFFKLNRCRRGLETCPQANLTKSGRKYCRLGAESYSSLGPVEKKRRK